MTILNRKAARTSLYNLLIATSAFQAGFKSLTKDTEGQSPIFTIESVASNPTDDPVNDSVFKFAVGVWVLRENADAAEDQIDDLNETVTAAVMSWYTANFYQESQSDYADLDDGQWRVEWFFVEINWQENYT